MTRTDLIDRAKAVIAEAYEEATELIVAYLERHPGEQLQSLCKEIDYENWNALRNKVQRAQGERKSNRGADSTRARTLRRAKQGLRESPPEEIAKILSDPTIRAKVSQAQQIVARQNDPPRYIETPAASGPSFIELVVRINSALIELEALVQGWQNPAAVPAEFSRESFGDIVQKALRIQDKFDDLVAAINNEDEDEFQRIVRNFGLVPS